MSWERRNGPEGPIWVGIDSVFDLAQPVKIQWWWTKIVGLPLLGFFGGWGGMLLVLVLLSELLDALFGFGVGPAFDALEPVGLALVPATALFCAWKIWRALPPKPPQFLCRAWKLTASSDALTYEAGPFDGDAPAPVEIARDGGKWSVRLSDIARVEIAPTKDWIAARTYPGFDFKRDEVQAVPIVEMQAFLFLADGTRRVFYTANADREGAGALALSVRSWIEARKVEVPPERGMSSDEGFAL